jgi:hypothetical protein
MMAKSHARKQREQLVRQGKLDPLMNRGSWHGVRPVTRSIPNKKRESRNHDYSRELNIS